MSATLISRLAELCNDLNVSVLKKKRGRGVGFFISRRLLARPGRPRACQAPEGEGEVGVYPVRQKPSRGISDEDLPPVFVRRTSR
jgi:hypothetical protein